MTYFFYSRLQRLMHRFNLHYMPPSYPDGDTVIWCHWCGARDVVKRANRPFVRGANDAEMDVVNAAIVREWNTPEEDRAWQHL